MALVQSFGAAEVVTGSCHLLQLDSGLNIMVDCGMFQGEVEYKNFQPFGFNPKDVDVLLITHAHLDHVGRIPELVKKGFNGRIITLRSTLDLAEVVLLDSAHLMEDDFHTHFKKAQRRGSEKRVRRPLYNVEDVYKVYSLPLVYAQYAEEVPIDTGVSATFHNAGHILDSAIITIRYHDKGNEKTVVFSGDLGNHNDMVMPIPDHVRHANTLYIESTYGDRKHQGIKESEAKFKTIIQETLSRQGNVIIPSFAIERTQEILCILKQLYDNHELPTCKIFLDSPMAIRATRLYDNYHQELSQCCNDYLKRDGSIFEFPNVHYTVTQDESRRINNEHSCIIIAGSGMCTGGRILHHFKNHIWNANNSVIFVGYQANGTLGRQLVEGAEWITLYHEKIKVGAKIHAISGFSAHADQGELMQWIRGFETLENIFLVHGEKKAQQVFKTLIAEQTTHKVHIVKEEEKIWI
ncbi:MAG: MBL fold metallo-hydrolase [Sulfurimonas sp.]|nr:MAG: MBL fold metallo-hydrolase [Sulfurimonas sp.]